MWRHHPLQERLAAWPSTDLCVLLWQGTILDRIDYNIEHSTIAVEKGLQQLQKAEKYQKKNRKMLCIMVLALVIVILIVILIAIKS